MSQLRNFCWTLNNYDETSLQKLKEWRAVTYTIAGKEVGESGTPHLQGYTELDAPKKFSTIKNILPTAHIEKRRGNADQASNYCKKDGNFEEWGEISHQGERNDLSAATDMIRAGKRMREVAEQEPVTFVKYHKGLRALKVELIQPRNSVPDVTVLVGATGKGKSKIAREIMGANAYYVWHPQCAQWFDGYEGESHAIFEEFRGQLPLGMMLSLLDRYDCKVQYKGGITEFAATTIVITSPVPPMSWYNPDEGVKEDKIAQLMRRISTIRNLETGTVYIAPTVPV